MYHFTTLKSLEHCGCVCFITLAVVAETASVSLNLKEHKTPREKAEVTALRPRLGSFSQKWKFCGVFFCKCFDDGCSCFQPSTFYTILQTIPTYKAILNTTFLFLLIHFSDDHISSIHSHILFRFYVSDSFAFATFMPFITHFPVFLL